MMNILRRVLVRKPPWPLIAAKPVRLVSSGPPPDELNEDLFWDNLKNSLNLGELTKRAKANQTGAEKRVFVLQLRMQFKSKARQSTTPELQLAESISLVETLRNWKVIDWYIVGMKHSYSKEMFGEGNQELLSRKIGASGANCLFVVIDHLTNAQTDVLRKTLLGNNPEIAIYDRYKLVLEIFKRNARTSIAKLQIALAEIPYIRHKYSNVDLYKNVEKKIKRELELKLKTRQLQSNDRRVRRQIPIVSVFGYTNVGKTSFIKAITGDSKLNPENKLFATLDISYHGTPLFNSSQTVLFADTIGFISDIPYNLIEAFKTSLQDALDADLYIHLIDVSHPDRVAQEKIVNEILADLGDQKKLQNMLVVYNKCDKVSATHSLDQNCKTGQGIEQLRERIESSLMKQLEYIELSLEVSQGGQELAYLYKNAIVKQVDENPNDLNFVCVRAIMNRANALKFVNLYPNVKISKK